MAGIVGVVPVGIVGCHMCHMMAILTHEETGYLSLKHHHVQLVEASVEERHKVSDGKEDHSLCHKR